MVSEIKVMKSLNRSDLIKKNEIPYFEIPEIAHLKWVRHAFLTRMGGMSPPPFESLNFGKTGGDSEDHVSGNKSLVAAAFGFDPRRFILLHQVHRDGILVLREPDDRLPTGLEYDAVITHTPNRFLGIQTADCLPILIIDKAKKVVAGIHAGRQGTACQITRKVVRKMKTEFGCLTGDLRVAVGPSIGLCCYEIDEKVFLQEWKSLSTSKDAGKWMVDLPGINMAQMKMEGIREDQIFRINLCTRCHPDLFFSYRGEGQTGRQLSFIGIAEANQECRSF
jgi:polyphenol oxidase